MTQRETKRENDAIQKRERGKEGNEEETFKA